MLKFQGFFSPQLMYRKILSYGKCYHNQQTQIQYFVCTGLFKINSTKFQIIFHGVLDPHWKFDRFFKTFLGVFSDLESVMEIQYQKEACDPDHTNTCIQQLESFVIHLFFMFFVFLKFVFFCSCHSQPIESIHVVEVRGVIIPSLYVLSEEF